MRKFFGNGILLSTLALSLIAASCSGSESTKTAPAKTAPVMTAEAKELEAESRRALKDLLYSSPGAKALSEKAVSVLVFPSIVKGGLIVGGQYGDGTLFTNDKAVGFYNSSAASYGLQAGLQKFGYALFFMKSSDLDYLNRSDGWEIGVGPSITIVDTGMANSFTTTTAREGVYAFFFSQKGLMAGLGLQGSKITQINPGQRKGIL